MRYLGADKKIYLINWDLYIQNVGITNPIIRKCLRLSFVHLTIKCQEFM